MTILDGKKTAALHKEKLSAYLKELKKYGKTRKLALFLVGSDEASALYAASVQKAAAAVGMEPVLCVYEERTGEDELVRAVSELSRCGDISGILPFLPLPKQYDERRIVDCIVPEKDVDGQTAASQGYLLAGRKAFAPCTARAVITVLDDNGITLHGRHVVIIGRSTVVGKPLLHLCLKRDATVTICHSKTKDLARITRQADILVAAVGKAGFVRADMVKDGAVIIDIGINRADGKTVGDVSEEATQKAAAYTPVPGGIGAVVSTLILENAAYGIQ